jgi:hypothetical protein
MKGAGIQIMHKLAFVFSIALVLFSAGCSETSTPAAKKVQKPPEPVTGRFALYEMYRPARAWAADVEILNFGSINIPEVAATPGKAGAWQATFVSRGMGRARSWTYSTAESMGNLHKGPFAGLEEGWSGPRGVNQPFTILAVKTDTDEVYKTALGKAKDYEKKNPGKPITFLLEKTNRHPDPTWRVVWGESVGSSNFSILVDASTGDYAETLR